MDYPSKLAKEYSRHRGFINASKESMEWYNSIKSKKGVVDRTQDWNKMFDRGKVYIFDYNPKTADILSFYDKNPMVLSLGKLRRLGEEGPLDLAINLNFIPTDLKENILDLAYKNGKSTIRKEFENDTKPGNQREIKNFTYRSAIKVLKNTGFEFSLRSYYKHRRKNTRVLSYSEWFRTLFLSTEDMVGVKISQVHAAYQADKNSGSSGGLLSRGLSALQNIFN